MTGETMDDGRIRLGHKWSQRIADDLDQRINQYDIVLPAGTSLETINRLRAIASDMANGYGMLAAEKDLIHALEQSKEILKQSAIAAGTAGLGSAFTAARASQVAWVANAGRAGQVAMGGYAAYEGGRGVVQGVQEIRQGNYLAGAGSVLLGGTNVVGGLQLAGSSLAAESAVTSSGGYTMREVRRAWWGGNAPVRSNPLMPKGREYMELSHTYVSNNGPIGRLAPDWIKNRGWNLNPMWGSEHALVDPARYQFMPAAWKAANPMKNALSRTWGRMPVSHQVTLGGSAVVGGGYLVYKATHE
jgi:hypothetical protein